MGLALKFRRIAPILLGVVLTAMLANSAAAEPAALRSGDFAVVDNTHLRVSELNKSLRVLLPGSPRDSDRKEVATSQIQNAWYTGEAKLRGITVSRKQVRRRFDSLVRQSFPKRSDYTEFLKQTKQTERQLLALVRIAIARERVQAGWRPVVSVTEEEILARFNQDPSKYALPETRDLRLIYTPSKRQAQRARGALDYGHGFGWVAREYSADRGSAKNGGKFLGVERDQFPPLLDKAVFTAKVGQITGPIKTQYGYYIFKVIKVTPTHPISFAEARVDIASELEDEKQQAAVKLAFADFTNRWRAATVCRAKFATTECGRVVP